MNPFHVHSKFGGFSLVEVLTAVGIGAVVLSAAGAILAYGQQRAQRTRDALAANVERSEVLRQLTEDAAALVPHPGNDFTMQTHLTADGDHDREMAFLVQASWPDQPTLERLADLAAVRYRLVDTPIGEGRWTRVLMRQFRSSKQIFDSWRRSASLHTWPSDIRDGEVCTDGVVCFDCALVTLSAHGKWVEVTSQSNGQENRQALRMRLVMASPSLRMQMGSQRDWDRVAAAARVAKSGWPRELREQLDLWEWVIPIGPRT